MNDPLAKANVEINADLSGVRKGVQDTKEELQDLGKAGDTAADRLTKSSEGPIQGFKRMASAITGVVGAATGLIGVTATLAAGITYLNRKYDESIEALRRQRREYADLNKVVTEFRTAQFDSVSAMFEAFDALARKIEDSKDLTQKQARELFYELRDITREREREVGRAERDEARRAGLEKRRVQVETARATRDQIEGALLGLSDAWLPEEDQIAERYRLLQRQLEKVIEQGFSRPEDVDLYVERVRAAISKRREIEQQALAERIANEEKAEIDKAKRVAKAAADAMQREMDRVMSTLNTSFGGNFTNMRQVADALDKVASAVHATRGRR